MKWRDIQARIEEGEGPRTEFKRGLGDLAAVGRTMCAFNGTEPELMHDERNKFVKVTFRLDSGESGGAAE